MTKSKKQIQRTIKQEMRQETPDVLDRISFHAIMNERKTRIHVPWYKKLSLPRLSTSLATVIVIALILFVSFADGGNGLLPPGDTKQPITLSAREEIYSISAMQSTTLFHQLSLETNSLFDHPRTLNYSNVSTNNYLINDYLPVINSYITMLEPIMSGVENYTVVVETSPDETYTHRVTFQTITLSNETVDFELHYNETQIDDDEFLMEGIMIIGGVTYQLEGEITLDDDEFEMTLIAYLPNQDDTYIELEIVRKHDEQSFEYEYVRRGETIFESSMTIEYDDDEIVAEIEYEDQTSEVELEIVRKLDGPRSRLWVYYDISHLDADEDGEIRIDIVLDQSDNAYYYLYTITVEDDHTFTIRKARSLRTPLNIDEIHTLNNKLM